MSIFLTVLIAIAVNLDNFLIGMNLGIRNQKLTIKSNGIIGLFTGICSYFVTAAAGLLTDNVIQYAHLFGAVIMILFGSYCLISELFQKESYSHLSIMTLRDTCILGLILAVNCIPPSFSSGMAGLNPISMGSLSALFSFLSMFFSNRLGETLANYPFLKFLTPLSSIILIFIVIFECFL